MDFPLGKPKHRQTANLSIDGCWGWISSKSKNAQNPNVICWLHHSIINPSSSTLNQLYSYNYHQQIQDNLYICPSKIIKTSIIRGYFQCFFLYVVFFAFFPGGVSHKLVSTPGSPWAATRCNASSHRCRTCRVSFKELWVWKWWITWWLILSRWYSWF